MTVSRERKRELRRVALKYAGDLVYEVVNSYEAFSDLPDDERAFMNACIQAIGERLCAQAKRS